MQFFLELRDIDATVVAGWLEHFSDPGPWRLGKGDVTALRVDAAITPANSFGFMDGGVDLAWWSRLGLGIQRKVQTHIELLSNGELPVGDALIVPTGDSRVPRLVVAPTMKTPQSIVGTENVYRAMRAALRAIEGKDEIRTVSVSGMGTGVGQMDPFEAARQMRQAIDDHLAGLSV